MRVCRLGNVGGRAHPGACAIAPDQIGSGEPLCLFAVCLTECDDNAVGMLFDGQEAPPRQKGDLVEFGGEGPQN